MSRSLQMFTVVLFSVLALAAAEGNPDGDKAESKANAAASDSPDSGADHPEVPLLAGVDGVTNPTLIPASKVAPQYPKRARKKRIESAVILQAVVRKDGKVDDLVVKRVTRPGHGFEKAAIKAVKKWRYSPALLNGDEPVDVYFTVYVDFKLR